MVTGMAVSNFVNPPYPFPYEDNLAFADFVRLQAEAADYLEHWHPSARVSTVWPLTLELAHPELGFVSRRLAVKSLRNFAPETLAAIDWKNEQVVVVYSRTWDPSLSVMHFGPVLRVWRHFYGYLPNATMDQARALAPFPIQQHFERHGQWLDIYVNPALPPAIPGPGGLPAVRVSAHSIP
jgi:hypothetical protein